MANLIWHLSLQELPSCSHYRCVSLPLSPGFVERKGNSQRDSQADWLRCHEGPRASSMPKSFSWMRLRKWTPDAIRIAWSSKISGSAKFLNFLRQVQPIGFPRCVDRFVRKGLLEAPLSTTGSSAENASTDGGTKDNNELLLEDGEYRHLAKYATQYNFVQVIEVSLTAKNALAGARVLLLDRPGNVHSIYQKRTLLTGSYYDIMAAFPAVIPEGPIGVFGLGAGTVARLIHHFWSWIDLYGWELDPGVIQAARKFFDLEDLEWKEKNFSREESAVMSHTIRRRKSDGSYCAWRNESDEVRSNIFRRTEVTSREQQGKLRVSVGDALHPDAYVDGGFAGIIVDLFTKGAVIPALQQAETWRQIKGKLRPHGRIIVNCGGSCVEIEGPEKKDGAITMEETIRALHQVFPQQLSITNLRNNGDNTVALTGPPPDFHMWKDVLPDCLRDVQNWRTL